MDLFGRSMLVALTTGALAFSACSHDEDLYNPGAATDTQKTDENFMSMVGSIDENHTWETVKDVEVSIPVKYGIGGTFNVVYYANGKVVGATTVADGTTLKGTVSVPSYTTELSVSLTTDKGLGTIIRVPVTTATQQKAPRTRADEDTDAASEGYKAEAALEYTNQLAYPRVYPGENESAEWGKFYGSIYVNGSKTPYVWPHKFYYVDNALNGIHVDFTEGFVEKIDEVFGGGDNNLSEETRDIIVQDYGLVTSEEGPVKLRFVSGTSQNHAAIGYFIYKDDPAEMENMDTSNEGMFNLLSELNPDVLQTDGNGNYWAYGGTIDENPTAAKSDLKTCNKYVIIEDMKDAGLESGDEIQLTYYDEQGNPSAYFPAGTKIGFFIVPNGGTTADHTTGTIDARFAVYSFSNMNVEPHQCPGYFAYWSDENYATSHVATFKVGNDIVVGFEDAHIYNSSDFDYNDFIFTIVGDFTTDVPEVVDPDPSIPSVVTDQPKDEVQVYTYCFEDMDINGGDYDFNDCVLKVTPPMNGKITVTLVAAGATYQLRAGLGDKYLFDGEELHDVFGVSSSTMVNTGLYTAAEFVETITVGDSWTVAKDGNFWVEVLNNNVKVYIPTFTPGGFEPGTVPYAIRIADDFLYPAEKVRITTNYPAFSRWANDATQEIDWYVRK